MIVYLNGNYVPLENAKISVLDRGFIFGDAVYEVWRLVGGKLFESDRHLGRLANGLRDLSIAPPQESMRDGLHAISERLVKENGLTAEGSLYLQISRGAPLMRTHVYPNPPVAPTVFIMASAFTPPEELRAKGGSVICIEDVRWNRCNVKTVQLLPNAMSKQEALEKDALDAIFIRDGIVTETTLANVFMVFGGEVWTHPLNTHVLPGVTRDVIIELAKKAGLSVREEPVPQAKLMSADEVFLVGTLSDVMPIVVVDGKPVGNGKPGPVTQKLFKLLRERLDATGKSTARG